MERMKDDVVGRMRDEMEALLSEESSGDEQEDEEDEEEHQGSVKRMIHKTL